MKKIMLLCKGMSHLINKHKTYFLAPIFIILAILAILVYYIGPAAIISFIYAGI